MIDIRLKYVIAARVKRYFAPVRGKSWIGVVRVAQVVETAESVPRQLLHMGTVGIHDVDVPVSVAVRGPGDPLTVGRPGGHGIVVALGPAERAGRREDAAYCADADHKEKAASAEDLKSLAGVAARRL